MILRNFATRYCILSIRRLQFPLLVLVFVGCSSSDPEIMQLDPRIVATFDPQRERIVEELHVISDVFDADGSEEISEITVIHQRRGLQWRGENQMLQPVSRGGQQWFPFVAAPIPPMREIPRGTYRIEVSDLSQATAVAEAALPLSIPSSTPEDFAVVAGSEILLPNGVDEITLILRSESEPRVRRIHLQSDREAIPLPENRPPGSSMWIVVGIDRYLLRVSGPW